MARLLAVHHTPSPAMQALLEAARAGAALVPEVEVVTQAALSASASELLAADAVLLGTPANLGYMSGALKHFFDQIYYPCLDETVRRPYGVYVHGHNDTVGAIRAIEMVTTGLQWRRAQEPVSVTGPPNADHLAACFELGAALAAGLM